MKDSATSNSKWWLENWPSYILQTPESGKIRIKVQMLQKNSYTKEKLNTSPTFLSFSLKHPKSQWVNLFCIWINAKLEHWNDLIKEKKHQPEQLNSRGLFRNKSSVGIMNTLAIHIFTLRKLKVVLLLHFIPVYNITLDANCQMPIVNLWSDDSTMHSWNSTGWF